jgi:hypothetical protein
VHCVHANSSGLAGRLRISSFAEANRRLYAAVGHQIYERLDRRAPRWRLVYTNPRPGHSESGLRAKYDDCILGQAVGVESLEHAADLVSIDSIMR